MATTGTNTTRDIVRDACLKIGVVAYDEEMDAYTAALGLRGLNRMLKSWQNYGYLLWSVASQSIVLTSSPAQTLDPERPIRILSARLVRNGIELPMCEMTRDEYDRLPVKTSIGTPTQFYYDKQREAARFYVWPTTTQGETVNITYEREIEDQTSLDDIPDVPGEWMDAVVYGLAARLMDDFRRAQPGIIERAERELRLALSADREGSVFFGSGDYASG